MKIGKLYKHMETGVVVECTTPVNDGLFGGSVVNGDDMYNIGDYFAHWVCNSFEEYEPIQALVSGQVYSIPEGYKAMVEDKTLTIKKDIQYYKQKARNFTLYSVIYLTKQTNIYIYNEGRVHINNISVQVGEKCSEKEFQKAKNEILKRIEF